jgi:hypothetical protein
MTVGPTQGIDRTSFTISPPFTNCATTRELRPSAVLSSRMGSSTAFCTAGSSRNSRNPFSYFARSSAKGPNKPPRKTRENNARCIQAGMFGSDEDCPHISEEGDPYLRTLPVGCPDALYKIPLGRHHNPKSKVRRRARFSCGQRARDPQFLWDPLNVFLFLRIRGVQKSQSASDIPYDSFQGLWQYLTCPVSRWNYGLSQL